VYCDVSNRPASAEARMIYWPSALQFSNYTLYLPLIT